MLGKPLAKNPWIDLTFLIGDFAEGFPDPSLPALSEEVSATPSGVPILSVNCCEKCCQRLSLRGGCLGLAVSIECVDLVDCADFPHSPYKAQTFLHHSCEWARELRVSMGSPAWHASSYRINRRDGFRCVDPSSHRVPYMETLCPIRVYKQETIAYMEAMPTRMIHRKRRASLTKLLR